MELSEYEALFDKAPKIRGVFSILKDGEWHCRECEYRHLQIVQIAGSGGIQGLKRGTNKRPGIVIESGYHLCKTCEKRTRQDKWNGQFKGAVQGSSMPQAFARRVIDVLGGKDVVEGTKRPANQLTIDHKLPMVRWSPDVAGVQTAYGDIADAEIQERFQLLKKSNGSVSHNMLKSRSCERCFTNDKRGKPFGIDFFYAGGPDWEPSRKDDPTGCVGCGWYDFAKWRKELNRTLKKVR